MHEIGLGNSNAQLGVYIENIPNLPEYLQLDCCQPLKKHEIFSIVEQTGNHWRKIFNVYAKLIFELSDPNYDTWQNFRDNELLQQHSNQKLIFTPPVLDAKPIKKQIHLVLGKTYASKLALSEKCQWLSAEFAINTEHRLIISPYFDYRQLSNIKISQLCRLIKQL